MAGREIRWRAEIEVEAVVGLLAHAQVRDLDVPAMLAHAVEAVAEGRHALHGRLGRELRDQCFAPVVHGETDGPAAVGERVEAFRILPGRHRHHPPGKGVERCRRHEHLARRPADGCKRLPCDFRDVLLHPEAPGQVGGAQPQPGRVPAQAARACERQRRDHPDDQRHGVERIDDEDAADPVRVTAERAQQLGAVHRHPVEQRMSHEREPECQPPALPLEALAMEPRRQRAQQRREQRKVEQGVGIGTVQDHVGDRVAMVDEGVQIGQRARHGAPQRGFPGGGAPAHGGQGDGGAEGDLGQGIHAGATASAKKGCRAGGGGAGQGAAAAAF